jgi:8-oxo-dGTP pyrophosphatase MutT (NUDIX family)
MQTIRQTIVSAIIFSRDDKILMGKKHPNHGSVYPDCWHIPGGGVDAGEGLEDAVRREIMEETGIAIGAYPCELVDNQGTGEAVRTRQDGTQVLAKMQFNVYAVTISDKDAADIVLSADDDLENLRWFTVNELATVKLTPPSVTLFQRLGILKGNDGNVSHEAVE